MMHFLEIQDKYFKDIKSNIKTFEIRRCNRDYKIKDILILNDLSIYNIDNILILGI